MKVLIDTDILMFKSLCVAEYAEYFFVPEQRFFRYRRDVDGYINLWIDEECDENDVIKNIICEPIQNVIDIFNSMVVNIVRRTGAKEYVLVMKGELANFRESIPYPVKYKGGRPPKPLNYKRLFEYILTLPNVHRCTGPWESDDELGILQDKVSNTTMIASIDKDLLQIPGLHYDITSEVVTHVTEAQGLRWFYSQMLQGDRVDNIIGVKGIAKKTAEKFLDQATDQNEAGWKRVVEDNYQRVFTNWKEMYEANKKLLWILREPLDGY